MFIAPATKQVILAPIAVSKAGRYQVCHVSYILKRPMDSTTQSLIYLYVHQWLVETDSLQSICKYKCVDLFQPAFTSSEIGRYNEALCCFCN